MQIDLCTRCKGVWFDDRELTELPNRLSDRDLAKGAAEFLAGLPTHTAPGKRSSYLVCPLCSGHMAQRNFREVSGILTDRCEGCGTWVDHDNLLKILRLVSSGQLPEVDRRAAEQRRAREANRSRMREPRGRFGGWTTPSGLSKDISPARLPPGILADTVTLFLVVLGFVPSGD